MISGSCHELHHRVTFRSTPFGDIHVVHLGMRDISVVRCDNLNAFLRRRGQVSQKQPKNGGEPLGSPSYMANELKRGANFWSDRLRGDKAIGEALAREIEEHFQMPKNALDGDGDGFVVWPFSKALYEAIIALDAQDIGHAESSLRAHLKLPQLPGSGSGEFPDETPLARAANQ